MLIFIICVVYSVLRSSWSVLLAGLIYFMLGHFTYKYQLLYAMDHRQQSTGRAWGMICDRIFVGLIFFQLTTAGQLILKQAVTRSVLMIPLVIATIWVNVLYGRAYKPLMKFIALRSVKRGEPYRDLASPTQETLDGSTVSSNNELAPERNIWADVDGMSLREAQETRRRFGPAAEDENHGTGLRFVNPSLVAPLDQVWIADKHAVQRAADGNGRSDSITDGEV
jgi:calcium permeable stress-gated cation channel